MDKDKAAILQGTLDLLVLKTVETMGPLHGWAIAKRIEQISEDLLEMKYGTLYPALMRLDQHLDASPGRHQDLIGGDDAGQPVSVSGDLIQTMAVQSQPIVEVGADIADPPQLGFSGTEIQSRIDEAVDGTDGVVANAPVRDLAIVELNVFQQQHPLPDAA